LGLPEDNYPTSCILVFLRVIGVVVLFPLGMPLPLVLYTRGWGYKEGNRVGYNMISIRNLSLFAYFTYVSIDIAIYALGNTPFSLGRQTKS
jgi:hypothetical protein